MPGCWEIDTKPAMVIGIRHTWEMHPDFMLAMLRLQKQGLIAYRFEHDKPWDLGLNLIANECLASGAEWCFFVDTDVLPPFDCLKRLLMHNQPIVSGLYYRRHPEIFPEMFHFRGNKFEAFKPEEIKPGLNEVDGVGAGCLLVNRRVFESMKDAVEKKEIGKAPEGMKQEYHEFFRWSLTEVPYCSEDLYFCWKLREKGWRIFVDADVSCGHVLSAMTVKDGRFQWSPLEVGQG